MRLQLYYSPLYYYVQAVVVIIASISEVVGLTIVEDKFGCIKLISYI